MMLMKRKGVTEKQRRGASVKWLEEKAIMDGGKNSIRSPRSGVAKRVTSGKCRGSAKGEDQETGTAVLESLHVPDVKSSGE